MTTKRWSYCVSLASSLLWDGRIHKPEKDALGIARRHNPLENVVSRFRHIKSLFEGVVANIVSVPVLCGKAL